mmetsp:Transcript_32499/g.85334  ORF Transcript_32499/g.85334 Transcript_32499/m.85334 type:complete len:269 (+) Transcript_32499:2121-2927(+)
MVAAAVKELLDVAHLLVGVLLAPPVEDLDAARRIAELGICRERLGLLLRQIGLARVGQDVPVEAAYGHVPIGGLARLAQRDHGGLQAAEHTPNLLVVDREQDCHLAVELGFDRLGEDGAGRDDGVLRTQIDTKAEDRHPEPHRELHGEESVEDQADNVGDTRSVVRDLRHVQHPHADCGSEVDEAEEEKTAEEEVPFANEWLVACEAIRRPGCAPSKPRCPKLLATLVPREDGWLLSASVGVGLIGRRSDCHGSQTFSWLAVRPLQTE